MSDSEDSFDEIPGDTSSVSTEDLEANNKENEGIGEEETTEDSKDPTENSSENLLESFNSEESPQNGEKNDIIEAETNDEESSLEQLEDEPMNDGPTKDDKKENYAYLSSVYLWNADEILPGLWMGDQRAAGEISKLKENNITHVLNVVGGEAVYPNDFKYLIIPALDSKEYDMISKFPITNAFIDEARKEGGVIVHCQKGISRSGIVTMAYVMVKEGKSFNQVADFVVEKRTSVCPNLGFLKQLQLFEDMKMELEGDSEFHIEYQQLKLKSLMTEELFKWREDPGSVMNPYLGDSLPPPKEDTWYLCKHCQGKLLNAKLVMVHEDPDSKKKEPSDSIFVVPHQWMGEIDEEGGRIDCPHCCFVLGGWNWEGRSGTNIKPAFFLVKKFLIEPEEASAILAKKGKEEQVEKVDEEDREEVVEEAKDIEESKETEKEEVDEDPKETQVSQESEEVPTEAPKEPEDSIEAEDVPTEAPEESNDSIEDVSIETPKEKESEKLQEEEEEPPNVPEKETKVTKVTKVTSKATKTVSSPAKKTTTRLSTGSKATTSTSVTSVTKSKVSASPRKTVPAKTNSRPSSAVSTASRSSSVAKTTLSPRKVPTKSPARAPSVSKVTRKTPTTPTKPTSVKPPTKSSSGSKVNSTKVKAPTSSNSSSVKSGSKKIEEYEATIAHLEAKDEKSQAIIKSLKQQLEEAYNKIGQLEKQS